MSLQSIEETGFVVRFVVCQQGGADVNIRNGRKNGTALHDVCLNGHFATAEALLELGKNLEK